MAGVVIDRTFNIFKGLTHHTHTHTQFLEIDSANINQQQIYLHFKSSKHHV